MTKQTKQAHKANLCLNSSKMKSDVRFMGQLITKDELQPGPRKMKAEQKMLRPKSKKELPSILGLANYLSKFLPRLQEVARPLRGMFEKEAKFIWSQQHETAFQEVQEFVEVKHPALKFYNLQEKVTVQFMPYEKIMG